MDDQDLDGHASALGASNMPHVTSINLNRIKLSHLNYNRLNAILCKSIEVELIRVRSPRKGANVGAIAAPSLLGVPEEAAGAKGGVAQGLRMKKERIRKTVFKLTFKAVALASMRFLGTSTSEAMRPPLKPKDRARDAKASRLPESCRAAPTISSSGSPLCGPLGTLRR